MRARKTESQSNGLGLFSILQIIFIVLKLCGLINWSWLWVLAPSWIGCIVILIVMTIVSILL